MGAEASKYHQEGKLLTPTMYRKGYKKTHSEPSRSPQPITRRSEPDEPRSVTPSSLFTSRSRTFERYSPIDNYRDRERERERERERMRDYDRNMEIMTLRKSPISYERRIGSRESTLNAGTSTREPLKQTNTNVTTSNRELARTSSPMPISPTPTPTTAITPILTKLNTEDITRIQIPPKSNAGGGGGKDSTNNTNPKYQYSSESKVEKIKSGATTTVQFTSLEKRSTSETTYSPLFYGHYSCTKCTRVWTSRIAREDTPQACSRCDTLILPSVNKPTE